jgi:hypothetical protein
VNPKKPSKRSITPESVAIAERVDGFPQDVREKLRDAVMRIADVYRASGPPDETEFWSRGRSNIIEVAAFRRRPTATSRRAKTPPKSGRGPA